MIDKSGITSLFCSSLRESITKILEKDFGQLQEIRLRLGKPVMLNIANKHYFLCKDGQISNCSEKGIIISENMMLDTLEIISDYSFFAYEEELKQGYITVNGGHRIGIVGKAIVENRDIKTLRYISGLNVRIAHEIKGCSGSIIKYIKRSSTDLHNTLIVSPPKCGKTTILRDLIRNISDTMGKNVGVIDERSEIAGTYKGIHQLDVGVQTDVLDACPKAEGMLMMLRSMGPEVIAVDEIGGKGDLEAIQHIVNAGVSLICTVHGYSFDDIRRKPVLGELIKSRIFDRVIILNNHDGVGTISSILDGMGEDVYKREGRYYVS